MATKNHVRSISLPSRPHPASLRVEDELNKLKSWESTWPRATAASSNSILSGLSGLEELYPCLDEFLNMGSTGQVVSRDGRDSSAMDEILDASVKVLDVCEAIREMVGQVKEHVCELTSAIRRRKCGGNVEFHVAEYLSLRKKVRKDAKRCAMTLKQLENKLVESSLSFAMLDQDPDFARAVCVLREVTMRTTAVFKSLVTFLSNSAVKSQNSGWQAISRLLVHKGAAVACEESQEDGTNELDCFDDALKSLLTNKKGGQELEKMNNQIVIKQLGELEVCVGNFEDGLESLFRRLIRSRATLLKVISQ